MSVLSILVSRVMMSEDITEVINLINGISDIVLLDGISKEDKCLVCDLYPSVSVKFPEMEDLLHGLRRTILNGETSPSSSMSKFILLPKKKVLKVMIKICSIS